LKKETSLPIEVKSTKHETISLSVSADPILMRVPKQKVSLEETKVPTESKEETISFIRAKTLPRNREHSGTLRIGDNRERTQTGRMAKKIERSISAITVKSKSPMWTVPDLPKSNREKEVTEKRFSPTDSPPTSNKTTLNKNASKQFKDITAEINTIQRSGQILRYTRALRNSPVVPSDVPKQEVVEEKKTKNRRKRTKKRRN